MIQSIATSAVLTIPMFFFDKANSKAADSSLRPRAGLLPIFDQLIVLTFDDGNKSDITYVAPLLKRYGFGATFYITEGFGAAGDRERRLTWEEIKQLHEDGFEIGNHTGSHPNLISLNKEQILAQVKHIEKRCQEHGLPKPTTFAYPGGHHDQKSVEVLAQLGYLFARRGVDPEYPLIPEGGHGPVYDPIEDHPLLVPSTTVSGPNLGFEDLVWAVEQAKDGRIAVLTFHGVPDVYPHCSTEPATFAEYMKYLHDQECTVIAMRGLAKYVNPNKRPKEPYDAIKRRLGVTPVQLKCEYAVNPLGIDVAQPRFNWVLSSSRRGQMQSAYQILVASSEENLSQNIADLWDSGKVVSEQSVNVIYKGSALKSGQKCWWKVRCWNKPGEDGMYVTPTYHGMETLEAMRQERPSAYSAPATFEMGLLKQSDWQGNWIGADKTISSPLLRKEFTLEKEVKRVRVYISGLGYYELYLNGEKVGNHVLDPGTTYYNNDQPIDLGSRVLYVTYDVTDRLRTGGNAVGVMLGHGWYSAEDDIPPSPSHREPYSDRPRLILQMNIEFADGECMSIRSLATSDTDTWKTSAGPITYNDYCNGETYDARLEKPGWDTPGYDDSDWDKASVAVAAGLCPARFGEAPDGVLTSQIMPAIKVMKTIKPIRILNPKENVYVYDFGQNFSGWSRLRVHGPRGTKVTLRHAARVYEDGTLDARSNSHPVHIARQTDTYILKGENTDLFSSPGPEVVAEAGILANSATNFNEVVWEPRFTLHGFRYVEVTGFPGTPTLENLEGCVVRSSVESSGSFNCSNPLINQIHHNIRWTFMSSMQSFPQDAADRSERVGWLGDPIPEDYIYNFDTAAFWAKWADDLKDAQKPNGDVPIICPLHWRRTYTGAYSLMPVWKSTYPLVVWYVYWYYGDERILAEHYDGLKRLVDFLGANSTDHILSEGLGDHMEPQPDGSCSSSPRHTPPALTSTAYYYYDAWIVAQAAEILGRIENARHYSDLAEKIKDAFNQEFLDATTNQYATGSQTSNALPLYFGMVPKEKEKSVVKNLIDDIVITHKGHLSTGLVGTNALAHALPKYGFADVMYQIATQTTFPSWGYQISKGATTLWESWDDNPEKQLSLNMKIFGSVDKFFYKDLAGISPAAPGYRQITIKPCIVGDLTYAKASIKTAYGMVSSSWKRNDDSFTLKVTLPVSSQAKVSVPKMGLKNVTISEGGETIWKDNLYVGGVAGITNGSESNDYVTFDVGSGSYSIAFETHR